MSHKYHPDGYEKKSVYERKVAEEEFKKVQNAYTEIMKVFKSCSNNRNSTKSQPESDVYYSGATNKAQGILILKILIIKVSKKIWKRISFFRIRKVLDGKDGMIT